MTLVANGHVHDLFDDKALVTDVLAASADLQFDRTSKHRALRTFVSWVARNPWVLRRGGGWAARKLWAMRHDLVASRLRVNKLSFFIHNFMGACQLEPERIDACIFMVATADGPVSMCLHNAKRDSFILKPFKLGTSSGERTWNPLTGALEGEGAPKRRIPLKGRARNARTVVRQSSG